MIIFNHKNSLHIQFIFISSQIFFFVFTRIILSIYEMDDKQIYLFEFSLITLKIASLNSQTTKKWVENFIFRRFSNLLFFAVQSAREFWCENT